MQRVVSPSPYEAKYGFCRALRVGNRILVAGTGPIEPDGVGCAPSVEAQARRCFEIARTAITDLGGTGATVVRTRMFIVDPADGDAIGQVHGEFFADRPPVATMVVVAGLLDPRWKVEIEAEAIVEGVEE